MALMNRKRSMEMGCRAFVMVVGLSSALVTSAFANPFGGLGGFGGFGNQGNQGNQGSQGGKKRPLTMVLPAQSLGGIQAINRAVNFNQIGVSQAAFGSNITQAAIVSASQIGGGAPDMMFLPYNQLGGIQQANLDLNINVIAVTQLAVGRNISQVALVSVGQQAGGGGGGYEDDDPFGGQQGGGQQGGGQQQGGTTLVAPYQDVPLLKTLNGSLNYNVTRVSQVAVGNNISQAAILNVGQESGGGSSPLGTPMFVPASQVGLYKALNLHLNINVVSVSQVAIGDNIQQLALITVGQRS